MSEEEDIEWFDEYELSNRKDKKHSLPIWEPNTIVLNALLKLADDDLTIYYTKLNAIYDLIDSLDVNTKGLEEISYLEKNKYIYIEKKNNVFSNIRLDYNKFKNLLKIKEIKNHNDQYTDSINILQKEQILSVDNAIKKVNKQDIIWGFTQLLNIANNEDIITSIKLDEINELIGNEDIISFLKKHEYIFIYMRNDNRFCNIKLNSKKFQKFDEANTNNNSQEFYEKNIDISFKPNKSFKKDIRGTTGNNIEFRNRNSSNSSSLPDSIKNFLLKKMNQQNKIILQNEQHFENYLKFYEKHLNPSVLLYYLIQMEYIKIIRERPFYEVEVNVKKLNQEIFPYQRESKQDYTIAQESEDNQKKKSFKVTVENYVEVPNSIRNFLLTQSSRENKIILQNKQQFVWELEFHAKHLDPKVIFNNLIQNGYIKVINEKPYEVEVNIDKLNQEKKQESNQSTINLSNETDSSIEKIERLREQLDQFKFNETIEEDGPKVLRPYQVEIVENIIKTRDDVIVELPTGSGKTLIAMHVIKHEIEGGGKVLFLTPKRVLLQQSLEVFQEDLNPYKIYGHHNLTNSKLLVSTLQTMSRRKIPEDLTLIIIDEAHFGHNSKMQEVIKKNITCRKIALSATPYDYEGHAISGYDRHINNYDINYLTKNNYLVKLESISPIKINLEGIHLLHGDYDVRELNARFNITSEVRRVIKASKEYVINRNATIVFAININHCILIAKEFSDNGIVCFPIHSKLSKNEQNILLESFKKGLVKVLVAVEQLTTGFDVPHVDTIVIARPTKSINLYTQMLGRVLRPYKDKERSLFIDCAGLIDTLGSLYNLNEFRKNYAKSNQIKNEQLRKDNISKKKTYLKSFNEAQENFFSQLEKNIDISKDNGLNKELIAKKPLQDSLEKHPSDDESKPSISPRNTDTHNISQEKKISNIPNADQRLNREDIIWGFTQLLKISNDTNNIIDIKFKIINNLLNDDKTSMSNAGIISFLENYEYIIIDMKSDNVFCDVKLNCEKFQKFYGKNLAIDSKCNKDILNNIKDNDIRVSKNNSLTKEAVANKKFQDSLETNQSDGESKPFIPAENNENNIFNEKEHQENIAKENKNNSNSFTTYTSEHRVQDPKEMEKIYNFLYQEYEGHCQICGDTFADGDKNISKLKSLSIGKNRDINRKGNSLCLCFKHHEIFTRKLQRNIFLEMIKDKDSLDIKYIDIKFEKYDWVDKEDKQYIDDSFYRLDDKDEFVRDDIYFLPIRLFGKEEYIKFTEAHMMEFIDVWNNY